jgi:hypothetical protein
MRSLPASPAVLTSKSKSAGWARRFDVKVEKCGSTMEAD